MDCKQCAGDLTAFLDSELNSGASEQIRSHLAACPSCSEEWRSLRESAGFIESRNRDLDLRAGSWNMIRARIAAETRPARQGFWFVNRWSVATATLAIFAALAVGYMQYQHVQRRNLEQYMSQYIQQREAQIKNQITATGTQVSSETANPYVENPFVEIKATVSDNPFLSEGR